MTEEINNISHIIRSTEEYSDVCDMCRDEILLYPTISGRTEYSQDEVEQITLKRIIDKLRAKEQECEELKKEINGYKTIIEKIRQEVQEDVTCESRECGCDSYEECIECLKNTILNIIDEGNDFVQGRVICKECGKYKQALDEIEKNLKGYCKNMCMAETKETCESCQNTEILDIINKAKK